MAKLDMASQEANIELGIDENEVVVEEEEEKWVKHYSSSHQILLVGDGDFSFSLCLASSFGSASNICASSLDSYDTVIKKYKNAKSNIETLEKLGGIVLHGVNATRMKLDPNLQMRKFDRIIFNFPHAGFYGKEDSIHLIEMHRGLVRDFFRNACGMLRPNGEVHVSHKTTAPFSNWNLEELATRNSLSLVDRVPFKIEDYPGYSNKRGDSLRCDQPFPLGECCTFKFRFSPAAKKKSIAWRRYREFANRIPKQFQEIPMELRKQETSFDMRYPHTNSTIGMKGFSRCIPLTVNVERESPRIFGGHFNNVGNMLERTGNDVHYPVHESFSFDSLKRPQTNFTRNMNDIPGYVRLPLASYNQRERPLRVFNSCFDNVGMPLGRAGNGVDYTIHEPVDGFRHPQTNLNDRPTYVGLPLTRGIQRESPVFNNVGMPLGRAGNGVDYTIHEPADSFKHPQTNLNDRPGYVGLPLTRGIQRESRVIFDGCYGNVEKILERARNIVDYPVNGSLSFDSFRYPQTNFTRNMNDLPVSMPLPRPGDALRESIRTFGGGFNNVRETLEGAGNYVNHSVHESPVSEFKRHMAEAPRRIVNDDMYIADEFRRLRALESAELRRMVLNHGHQFEGMRNAV